MEIDHYCYVTNDFEMNFELDKMGAELLYSGVFKGCYCYLYKKSNGTKIEIWVPYTNPPLERNCLLRNGLFLHHKGYRVSKAQVGFSKGPFPKTVAKINNQKELIYYKNENKS